MKIKGYTLHGDYYLADKVILNKTWEEACKTKEEVILPNGKKVITRILSKEELETIPRKERKCGKWYWTRTPYRDDYAWLVGIGGDFIYDSISYNGDNGGARLGFHRNEIKHLLDVE